MASSCRGCRFPVQVTGYLSASIRVLAGLTIAFLFYAAGVLGLADLGWKADLDLPPDAVE